MEKKILVMAYGKIVDICDTHAAMDYVWNPEVNNEKSNFHIYDLETKQEIEW